MTANFQYKSSDTPASTTVMSAGDAQKPISQRGVQVNWILFSPGRACRGVFPVWVSPDETTYQLLPQFVTTFHEELSLKVHPASFKFWTPKKPISVYTADDDEWTASVVDFNSKFQNFSLSQCLAKAVLPGSNKGELHVVITIEDLLESVRYREIIKNQGEPSSTAAQTASYALSQENTALTIHDGLYSSYAQISTIAPPLEIFHPIFGRFVCHANDTSRELPYELLGQVQDLMLYTSGITMQASAANAQYREKLSRILGVDIDEGEDEVQSYDIESGGERIPLLIVECTPQLWDGDYDPVIQAGCRMRQFWAQSDRRITREKCGCPTLMVVGGGPWICVLGGVFTDKVVVQRLTDMIWLGLSTTFETAHIDRVARVMMALAEGLRGLESYYQILNNTDIPPLVANCPHPRYYPYATSFSEDGRTVRFDYMAMLEDDARCVTYPAKIRSDTDSADIVVKFVDRYSPDAHALLARMDYAPRLRYCGAIPGEDVIGSPVREHSQTVLGCSMQMVVMDHVTPHLAAPDALNQLENALTALHTEGYVFGDLRTPNILFGPKGKVKFINFDWSGRYDMRIQDARLPGGLQEKIDANIDHVQHESDVFVCYPLGLSGRIGWAAGVGDLLPIRPQHDWDMLKYCFFSY